MSERILVVDDEPDILELVRLNLAQEGFDVAVAENAADAMASMCASPPHLVILDLMLPDRSGADICREMRSKDELQAIPIIMLTAKSEEVDRIVGLELGADDYVTKPFSPRELSLRVRAILRRKTTTPDTGIPFRHGPLMVDLQRHRCCVDDRPVELTAKEFALLAALISRPGRVLTREQLLEEIWGPGVQVTLRTIDTHLKRLREKLGGAGDLIDTIRGVGYRFSE